MVSPARPAMGQAGGRPLMEPGVSSPAEEIAAQQAFAKLRDRAYRLLARREHSRWELHEKLQRHDDSGQLDAVIEALIDEGSLSDTRFAELLVRSKVAAGKGPRLIEQELRRHRLENALVDEVLSGYAGGWKELAESVRRKKFGTETPADYKAWSRQARFLQQRGFSTDHIGGYKGG